MMLRRLLRAVSLAAALARCTLRYWRIRMRGPLTLHQRALWLQSASCGVLAALGIQVHAEGALPASGLVVSNHLSYLDIVIYSAVTRCFFVAKAEVSRWPFFGFAARAGGTIFLNRSSHASANAAADLIAARLASPLPVLLFPEGTSTDGRSVQRFHRRLIQPAIEAHAPLTAAAIRYLPATRIAESDLCWCGDAGFLRHLWKVLGAPRFSAHLTFGLPHIYADTRIAAEQTRSAVAAMREGSSSSAELAEQYSVA